jgi:aryl-alcohol dehydrogenase-like predicted oxidoreductase
MIYRKLGKHGVKLSCMGLGSWITVGGRCDDQASMSIVRRAYDSGVNFFDTADIYGGEYKSISQHGRGQSEDILGRTLEGIQRSSYILLTKLGGVIGTGPNDRGLSAKHIIDSCHASLKRLRTDYIDIYMFHRPDPDTPVEESIRAIEDLARQGKILYWGISQYSPAQIEEVVAVSRQLGARPPSANEPRYNLLHRQPEHELFDVTSNHGIGNVTFSPLAHGMLSGKYAPGQPPPDGSRAATDGLNSVIKMLYWTDENLSRGQLFAALARELDLTSSQLAYAWILSSRHVTSTIMGVKSIAQLEDNLKAADVKLSPETVQKIDQLYPLQNYYKPFPGDFMRSTLS